MMNFLLSYVLLSYGVFHFSDIPVPWTTPALLSAYLLTDSIYGAIWQLFLILLGVLIYVPFVKKVPDINILKNNLKNKLNDNNDFRLEDDAFDIFSKHQEIHKTRQIIAHDIKNIIEGNLILYYQPQIDIKTNSIYGYEALIRLQKDNKIFPPLFLKSIEDAHLESVLDKWVLIQVKKDMDEWKIQTGKNHMISINIYPKTLLYEKNVDFIIQLLHGYPVKFELLEKGFPRKFTQINASISRLKKAGFLTAVDDFGTEEANLSLLGAISTDTVKLDKKLLRNCNTKHGLKCFISSCTILHEMGFKIVSEGVETKEELEIVKASHVDLAQGWYYAKALPFNEAIHYHIPDSK